MNIPSSMRGCEVHGVCFVENESCATGHCAQIEAVKVYSDLFPHMPRYKASDRSDERAKDQALADAAAERIRRLDENTLFIALWLGFCCVLFWVAFVASVVLIYRADSVLREIASAVLRAFGS